MVSKTQSVLIKKDVLHIAQYDTLWIVRSAGERTTALCRELIIEYFNPTHIETIRERPFTAAVKKSFSLGAESKVKWTVCIDADVLLEKDGMLALLTLAEKTEDTIFCIQGQVCDKLIPIKRPAGNHIYRNSLMSKAIPVVPEDITLQRPESETTRAMKSLGYYTFQTNVLIGIHDYEQYYEDIARKSFIHANKHEKILVPLLDGFWYKRKELDIDLYVAWLGSLVGKAHDGDIIIDTNFKKEVISKLLSYSSITEKAKLEREHCSSAYVKNVINNFRSDPHILKIKNPRADENYLKDFPVKKMNSPGHRLKRKLMHTTGKILLKSGRYLTYIANHKKLN